MQALADAQLAEQVDRALLEHAGAHALLDVVARARPRARPSRCPRACSRCASSSPRARRRRSRPASARRVTLPDDRVGCALSTDVRFPNRCADRPARRRGRRARARRRHGRARGLHPPDPVRRRPRDHPAGPPRPDAGPDDAGHHLRPADRRGLRAQAGLLLGRQPRRRLAAPLPRRRRARLAACRSRSRSTATPAWPTATRPARPGCRSRCCAATRAPTCVQHTATIAPITCPFTGEVLTAVPALRPDVGDHPRAARRPRTATCSCGASSACRRRRCSRPRRVAGHGRGDRRRARAAARARSCCPPGRSTASPRCRGGAHPSYAHGYYERDNDAYRALGRDQPRPRTRSRAWLGARCSARREPRVSRSAELDAPTR